MQMAMRIVLASKGKPGPAERMPKLGTTGDGSRHISTTVTPADILFIVYAPSARGYFSGYSDEASVTTAVVYPVAVVEGAVVLAAAAEVVAGEAVGNIPPPTTAPTNVTFSGSAYPLSQVFILKDGQVALQTIAGPDANFSASLGGFPAEIILFRFTALIAMACVRRCSLFRS